MPLMPLRIRVATMRSWCATARQPRAHITSSQKEMRELLRHMLSSRLSWRLLKRPYIRRTRGSRPSGSGNSSGDSICCRTGTCWGWQRRDRATYITEDPRVRRWVSIFTNSCNTINMLFTPKNTLLSFTYITVSPRVRRWESIFTNSYNIINMLFAQKNFAVIQLHHRKPQSAGMSEYIYEFIQHN